MWTFFDLLPPVYTLVPLAKSTLSIQEQLRPANGLARSNLLHLHIGLFVNQTVFHYYNSIFVQYLDAYCKTMERNETFLELFQNKIV